MTHYMSMKHNNLSPGADPGFQVRGGGGWGALKKMAPSGGRRETFWGISCGKNTILRQKKHILSNCGGRREKCWGISCEKSRFYAKKSYFFQLGGEGGAPGAHSPHPGSAPVHLIHLMIRQKTGWTNLRRITRWAQRDRQNGISFRIVVSNNYLKQHSLDLNTNDICSNVMYILSNFSSNVAKDWGTEKGISKESMSPWGNGIKPLQSLNTTR